MKAVSAQGANLTQNADSSWSVVPWDYNGDLLGYAPWDTLQPASFVDGSKSADHQSPAHIFFDSHAAPTRTISARTELAHKQDAVGRISEPGSELLMLIALTGLAIMVRRKMPE